MLQLFHLDVAKVDLNVAYMCKCFKCFHMYVCKCFYLDVAIFCNGHTCFQVFSGVLHVFQMYVAGTSTRIHNERLIGGNKQIHGDGEQIHCKYIGPLFFRYLLSCYPPSLLVLCDLITPGPTQTRAISLVNEKDPMNSLQRKDRLLP
jgi:hypothetical protein